MTPVAVSGGHFIYFSLVLGNHPPIEPTAEDKIVHSDNRKRYKSCLGAGSLESQTQTSELHGLGSKSWLYYYPVYGLRRVSESLCS